jgi:hypothetical protein
MIAIRNIFLFLIIGLQLVWSFSMTMNKVIPWLSIVNTSTEYVKAKFIIEKLYYHKSNTPKSPDTWEVVGITENKLPARIVYGNVYKTSNAILNEVDFYKEFQIGQQFNILIRYSLDYKNELRVINFNKNFQSESKTILWHYLIYAYGHLLVTLFFFGLRYQATFKQPVQLSYYNRPHKESCSQDTYGV